MKIKELNEALKAYKKLHKLRNYELARFLGTTEINIYRWLNKNKQISKSWEIIISAKINYTKPEPVQIPKRIRIEPLPNEVKI